MTTLLLLAALAVGYLIGRWQPARRVSDWAAWQRWGARPAGLRYAAVVAVQSADNLVWIVRHPRQTWHAWRTRNTTP